MRRRSDEWPDWEQNPPGPRRVLKWVIIGAVILFFVIPAIVFVTTMLSRPAQVAQRVTDPDRLIATYEGYYDKCTAIVAYDHNIASAEQVYKDAKQQAGKAGDDPLGLKAQDVQQARTNWQGLLQRRRELAEQYNADSLKITNLNGLTKGDDLPPRIEEGQTPKCGNNSPEF